MRSAFVFNHGPVQGTTASSSLPASVSASSVAALATRAAAGCAVGRLPSAPTFASSAGSDSAGLTPVGGDAGEQIDRLLQGDIVRREQPGHGQRDRLTAHCDRARERRRAGLPQIERQIGRGT
jgi:hypothetical protein